MGNFLLNRGQIMNPHNLSEILRQHPFFEGLSEEHLDTVLGCASNVRFAEGTALIREGEVADRFYLIREGRAALEVDIPGRGSFRVHTVGPGEFLGWSWLISPYRWHFTAIAVADTLAIAMDGACLRKKCDDDPKLGYAMLKSLSQIMEHRLEAMRLQLVDFYGEEAAAPHH
jgi:CRP/FNR family cyclic AMP-dependent transcriptional regulator